jgi:putative peptidoglycan lipid II flippase
VSFRRRGRRRTPRYESSSPENSLAPRGDVPLQADSELEAVAGRSITGAFWTGVSRVTGLVRVAMIAAVLGPTYLGNTYQATNLIPLLTYEFLTGSLLGGLIVPPLVRHIRRGDPHATARLACGLLGAATVAFSAIVVLVILIGPLLLQLLAIGVEDEAIAEEQRTVGWLLLALLMPQIVLYAVAGTGGAVMIAHGRFALPAAASAFENVGVVTTLASVAFFYGTGTDLVDVPTGELLLLGIGTTASVGLNAAVQFVGARRALGVRLVPIAGWRNPEVRAIARRVFQSLGYSALTALQFFMAILVANRVAGGVVAFMLAFNFLNVPLALGARPVANALLPRLSQLYDEGARLLFREELVRGASLVLFLTVPVAVAYVALAEPIARAASFGEMATPSAETLIAVSLAGLSLAVVPEAAFWLSTLASYAADDARSPLASMSVRAAVTLAGMGATFLLSDPTWVLTTVGLTLSAGAVAGSLHLGVRLKRNLPAGAARLVPSLLRTLAGSLVAAVVAYAVASLFARWASGGASDIAGVGLAVFIGAGLFLVMQRAWRSPELTLLVQGFRQLRLGA